MGKTTGIKWTDHTFNAWIGCTKISPGCDNCYAEELDQRFYDGEHWGKGSPRRVMADKYWKEPLKWNKEARDEGRRHRVFCSSLADVFDHEAPEGQRERLWQLIKDTPGLDWQLLTKRPENFKRFLPSDWTTYYRAGGYYPNVWLGVTVEDQDRARKRIPMLAEQPAALRFLSCEPLLEEVDLTKWLYDEHTVSCERYAKPTGTIHWVIVGGESGRSARVCQTAWMARIVEDCQKAEVAVFVKQLGSRCASGRVVCGEFSLLQNKTEYKPLLVRLKDKKGGDFDEFPQYLKVREFPR